MSRFQIENFPISNVKNYVRVWLKYAPKVLSRRPYYTSPNTVIIVLIENYELIKIKSA